MLIAIILAATPFSSVLGLALPSNPDSLWLQDCPSLKSLKLVNQTQDLTYLSDDQYFCTYSLKWTPAKLSTECRADFYNQTFQEAMYSQETNDQQLMRDGIAVDAIAKTLKVRGVGWQDFLRERQALQKIRELFAHDFDAQGREWIVTKAQQGLSIEQHPDWVQYVGARRTKIDPAKLETDYGQEDCDQFVHRFITAVADANWGYVAGCSTIHFGKNSTVVFVGSGYDITANFNHWVEWRGSPPNAADGWRDATLREWKTRYPLRNGRSPPNNAGVCDTDQ